MACQRVGIRVILVTGRPASWVQGMVEYLPVAGGIGENGGLYCSKAKEAPMQLLITDDSTLPEVSLEFVEKTKADRHRVFDLIKQQYPFLRPTGDCVTRLTDFTFPLVGLSSPDLVIIAHICAANGWGGDL